MDKDIIAKLQEKEKKMHNK